MVLLCQQNDITCHITSKTGDRVKGSDYKGGTVAFDDRGAAKTKAMGGEELTGWASFYCNYSHSLMG